MRYLTVISLLLFTLIVQSQNLIPNPGFEEGTPFCGIMAGASSFNNALDSWYAPSNSECDIYYTAGIDNDCYNFQPVNDYPGPIGIKGSELAHGGNVFVGIRSYSFADLQQREYMQNVLTEPTVPGQTYVLSCWISAADSMESFSNNQCFHLSTEPIMSTNDLVIELTPTSYSVDIIDTTDGWVLYTDTIVADDEYLFITVGNFFNDASTSLIDNPNSNMQPGNYGAYYFYDDISLEPYNDVSISGFSPVLNATIAPNPATEELRVSGPDFPYTFSITTIYGHTITRHYSDGGVYKLNISSLQPGMYLLNLFINGKRETHRFIKR